MKLGARFALRVALVWACALALAAAAGWVVVSGMADSERAAVLAQSTERAPALAFAALLLAFVCGLGVHWLFAHPARAMRRLSEQAQLIVGANPAHRVAAQGVPEVDELAHTVNLIADAYQRGTLELESRVAEASSSLEEERNRLAALMSELSEGVLVCNTEGRILLYNERARALFAGGETAGAYAPVGLGRSLFGLLDRDQVAHALEKLQHGRERGEASPTTRFVTGNTAGRLLKIQAAPFLHAQGSIAGMVLTLDDVTSLLDRESQRLSLLQSLAAEVRAPVASIRAAAEALSGYPDMEGTRRSQFVDIVASDSRQLSESINKALREYADALKASLALEDMRAVDLVSASRRRIEGLLGMATQASALDEGLWLRVDSFAFVQALAFLAARLRDEYGVRSLHFELRPAEPFVELDMAWSGAIVLSEALSLWEVEPMRIGPEHTPLTLRDVLGRHGAEAWITSAGPAGGRSSCFRFLVPSGQAAAPAAARPAPAIESRPEYYDFDLFSDSSALRELQERKLSELSYTVFDTETTGLEPSAGDEIISIGAVRIVNGRLLKNEVFEQLVDPRRPLSPASVRVHGIDARALKGQPTIDKILPVFHRFCEETVLVAHNAAFDMRFLELKEAPTGVRFTQPVLDTLLLSAVVHPSLEDHNLEAIAQRLGVRVIGRHTALGDALLAGEIFLRLIALLAGRGIVTLRQALAASRETYYARLHY